MKPAGALRVSPRLPGLGLPVDQVCGPQAAHPGLEATPRTSGQWLEDLPGLQSP